MRDRSGKYLTGEKEILRRWTDYCSAELLTLVKRRKVRWFGDVSRASGLPKAILQGKVKGKRE